MRKVIHAFNEEGFDSLDPDYRGGRPKKTTPAERDRIVAVARARPDPQGVPLTRWSLPKLREHLAGMGICSERGGAAPDADRRRALAPAHALVEVEPGPGLPVEGRACAFALQSQARGRRGRLLRRDGTDPADPPPRLGLGLAQAARAAARDLQASPTACATCSATTTYTQTACTGGYAQHKNAGEVLAYYRQIRMRYDPRATDLPDRRQPLHPQDPGYPRVGRSKSNVELVFTPTYASFLNRIECHFWGIGEFVVKNADYPDWETLTKAMADHITYRNGPHRDQRLLKAERRLLIAA